MNKINNKLSFVRFRADNMTVGEMAILRDYLDENFEREPSNDGKTRLQCRSYGCERWFEDNYSVQGLLRHAKQHEEEIEGCDVITDIDRADAKGGKQ